MRIEGHNPIAIPAIANEMKSTLQKGDIFQGEIKDITKGQIIIQLLNGQTIPARMSNDLELTIGQKLLFEIKDMNVEQMLLKVITNNETSPKENRMNQILIQAGIPINDVNTEMVSQLLEEGQPIDKQSLHTVYKGLKQNPELKLPDFVALIKNNIPQTEDNIKSYLQIKNGTAQLNSQIQKIISNSEVPVPFEVKAPLLDQLALQYPEIKAIFLETSEIKTMIKNSIPLEVANPSSQSEEISSEQNNILSPKNSVIEKSNENNSIIKNSLNTIDQKDILVKDVSVEIKEKVGSLDTSQKDESILTIKNGIDEPLNTDHQGQKIIPITKQWGMLDNEFESILQELGVSSKGLTKEIISQIKDNIADKILEKFISIDQEDLMEEGLKDKVKEVLKNIIKIVDSLQDQSETKSSNSELKQVERHIQMTNELNKSYQFLQMPLKFDGQWVNNELYVITDKKKLKSKNPNDPVTALLRLDLANLGKMDIMATKTGKQVDVKFNVDDTQKKQLITQRIGELSKGLSTRGYQLVSYQVTDESKSFDFTNQIIKQVKESGQEMKRYSFDMRI